jgi:hypothetical protein
VEIAPDMSPFRKRKSALASRIILSQRPALLISIDISDDPDLEETSLSLSRARSGRAIRVIPAKLALGSLD